MRKGFQVMLASVMSLVVLSGCGGNSANSESTPSSGTKPAGATEGASASAKTSESITLWTNFQVEAELLQKYADKWSEETGNKATVVQTSIELQQFAQAANSAGGPDGIFGIANDQLASFVTANLAEEVPADFYNDSDYVSAAVQASYVDGKRYGVPIAVETVTLFYNTDKVSAPPTTWDELLATAKTSGGVKFDATSIYYDLGFVRAFDSYIFKWADNAYDIEDIGLGNDGAVQAYGYIKKMVDEGFISSDITFDIARSAFENGETAYYIGGPWDVDAFASAGVNFAVVPMPTLNGKPFVTPVGTQVGFVSSKSTHKDAVWDFYRYLIDEASAELYQVGARIPAKLSVQQQIEMDATTQAFMQQIASGEPLPSVPELGQLWTPYTDNMRLLFQGKLSPEEAAKYIDSQFKEAIELMHSGS
ncbi:sugar ABC transporter substrate-binding protein [Cohnella fermenti]|uniref:Maltodextrin-binding protein n=1 Tax=Cohnella fermenti TaxID=2565925 RepID=A0A4S4BV68_9BACL|nr:extracellular solute-binding protein [Cohnella fermenti]THF79041.1 extracellular solute-binding protein [Cohnella fermenti]